MRSLVLLLVLLSGALPTLLARSPGGSESGCVALELELPAEFLLFDPELPPGAEANPSLFLIDLEADPASAQAAPQRLACTRIGEQPSALARFEVEPLELAAGSYELFLAEAGFAARLEVLGGPQTVELRVPEPVAVRLLPHAAEGALGAPPMRVLWRVELEQPYPGREVPLPMREARPASDGIGYVMLACGGRLSLASADYGILFEQPAEPLVAGPVELDCWWSAAPASDE